jgi:uncharacterized membrane protein YfcA
MLDNLLLSSAGLAVGFLVGLTGVGGGAFMTPLLILGFNIAPAVAIATDLLFATITKLSTIPLHKRQGAIDWKSARMVWAGSLPAAVAGVILVVSVLQGSPTVLIVIIAFVLVATSISMLSSRTLIVRMKSKKAVSFAGGVFIGLAVSITSVGAGALGMTIFRAILGGKNVKNLVGTDIVHAIPLSLIAGGSYLFAGVVNYELLFLLVLGSIPGAIVGARLSGRLKSGSLRFGLALILFLSGFLLLASALT